MASRCCKCWPFSSKNHTLDILTELKSNSNTNDNLSLSLNENSSDIYTATAVSAENSFKFAGNEKRQLSSDVIVADNAEKHFNEKMTEKIFPRKQNEKKISLFSSTKFLKCNKFYNRTNYQITTSKSSYNKNINKKPKEELWENNIDLELYGDDYYKSLDSTNNKNFSSNNSSILKNNNIANCDHENEGNPRNKCALKPGHSLMDWIRLGSSGIDLSGTKGVLTPINTVELSKHCKQNDAWLAIRGKVYNVTQYMDFHPGGPDELCKGIGGDATKLFDEVHAWVNYEQLLAKCYIGPLRNVTHVDLEPIKPRQKATTPTPSSGNNDHFKTPSLQKCLSNSVKSSPIKPCTSKSSEQIKINSSDIIEDVKKPLNEIIPRFDWIQKTSDLLLIFYTKPFCNPGIHLTNKCDNEIDVRIFIETVTHLFKFKFHQSIKWPIGSMKIARETGKIEFLCFKAISALWTAYGVLERETFLTQQYRASDEDKNYEYEIEKCVPFNHDSFALILRAKNLINISMTPIGYHVSLTAFIDGEYVTRSYTPVPVSYIAFECSILNVPILIKSYSEGVLAKYITNNLINQSISVALSLPKGNFQLTKLLDHTRIGLIAAGSGITPILGVLDHLLIRINNRIEHIELMFFNKTEEDIWCREKLEVLSSKDNRLVIRHILSDIQDDYWNGEKGRISEDLIASLNDVKSKCFVTFCCVCGPQLFNDYSLKLLTNIGYSIEQMHFFQG